MSSSRISRWLPRFLRPGTPRTIVNPPRRALGFEALEHRDTPVTNFTWDGGGLTQLWSEPANWTGNIAPSAAVPDVNIIFTTNESTIQDIANLSIDRITFSSGGTVALNTATRLDGNAPGDQVLVNGGTVTFNGAGGLVLNAGNSYFDVATGSKIVVTGAISGSGGLVKLGSGTLELRGTGTWQGETNLFDGTLALNNSNGSNNTVPATNLIVGNGTGGSLTATLNLLAQGQIPATADLTVRSDGVLNINGKNEGFHDLTLNGGLVAFNGGTFILGGDINVTSTSTMTMFTSDGTLALGTTDHTITVAGGQSLTVNARIDGTGGIIKDGPGTLVYDSQTGLPTGNSYTGNTTVKDGTLVLDNDGFKTAMGGNLIIGDGTGAGGSALVQMAQSAELPDGKSVVLLADGKWDLNGKNDTIGQLVLGGGSVDTNGGQLSLNGNLTASASASTSRIDGVLNLPAGDHTFSVTNGSAIVDLQINGVITGAGNLILEGTGASLFDGPAGEVNLLTGTVTVKEGTLGLGHGGTNGSIPGDLVIGDGTGAAGSARVYLAVPNQIADDRNVIVQGDGLFDLNGHADAIGNLILGGGGSVITGAGSLQLAGHVSTAASAVTSTIAGNLTLLPGDHKFQINDGAAGIDFSFDGNMTGSGGFIKDGAGVMELKGGNNGFAGMSWIKDGTLNLNTTSSDSALSKTIRVGDGTGNTDSVVLNLLNTFELPDSAALTIERDGRVHLADGFEEDLTSLTINGGHLSVGANSTFYIRNSGSVAADGTAGSLIDGDGAFSSRGPSVTFSVADGPETTDLIIKTRLGEFVPNSLVIKDGPGTLEIAGTQKNTYTGPTNVNAGVLLLNQSTQDGAISSVLNISNATVRYAQGGEISDTATVNVMAGGVFDTNGKTDAIGALNLFDDAKVIAPATLRLNGDITASGTSATSRTMTGSFQLLADRTFTVADSPAASDLIINGTILGTGGLIKDGPGTLEIAGLSNSPNTYEGKTWVRHGTLLLNDNGFSEAVSKTVEVGDGTGTPGSAVLQMAQSTEIPDDATVTIRPDGAWEGTFNGLARNEVIGSLVLEGGEVRNFSSLRLNGDLTVLTSPQATRIDATLVFAGGNHNMTVADNAASVDLLIDGPVTQSMPGVTVVKNGPGTVVIGDLTTITGPWTISEGTVLAQANASGTPFHLAGGTLGGIGSVGDVTGTGGFVAPGSNGPGTLTTKNLQPGAAAFPVQLNGLNSFDQIKTVGTVNLTGSSIAAQLGYASAKNDSFVIVDNDGTDAVIGKFANTAADNTFTLNGRTFQVNYAAGDGNDVAITDVTSAGNTPPIVSNVLDQQSNGAAVGPLAFSVNDAETSPANLTVTASSSNQALLPDANIQLGGSGSNRTMTVTPVAGQTGTATVTITVTDAGGMTASETFVLTVNAPANTPPTISDIGNTLSQGMAVGPVAFTVGDAETPAATLVITAQSSNPVILPNANIQIGGSGSNRTISLTPVAGQFGTTTITVTVTDAGNATASDTFTLNVMQPGSTNPALVGYSEFGTGSDKGNNVAVHYNPDGTVRYSIVPFGGFTGGVRTAAGDFNGDGIADLVVGTGPGRATNVQVLDGVTQQVLFTVDPFEAAFTGGVFVAAGDMNGDGMAELLISPDEGGGPRVQVYNGADFVKKADFFGIGDPDFRGGARANVGDLNGDGLGDLVVSAGFGGGPRIAAFDGALLQFNGGPKLFGDFFAFEPELRNGAYVAAGDLNGDGFAELIAGAGPGGGPRVLALDGQTLTQNNGQLTAVANFFGGNVDGRGGIRVAVKDLDGDNKADLVVGAGTGAGSRVTAYLGKNITANGTPPAELDFDAFAGFTGGVFVG